MNKITEEEFVALMNRIPSMEEKLNKLLFAFEKIVANNSLEGIIKNDSFPPMEYSDEKAVEDIASSIQAKDKRDQASTLQQEADDIERELRL